MKKYIIGGFIILFVVCLMILFFPKNYFGKTPKTSEFELEVNTPLSKYNSDQEIYISATLKNCSFTSYVLTHSSDIVTISYAKDGMDREPSIVPAINKSCYIGPKQKMSYDKIISLHEKGRYTIFVDALFRINGLMYEYTQSFEILVE